MDSLSGLWTSTSIFLSVFRVIQWGALWRQIPFNFLVLTVIRSLRPLG